MFTTHYTHVCEILLVVLACLGFSISTSGFRAQGLKVEGLGVGVLGRYPLGDSVSPF